MAGVRETCLICQAEFESRTKLFRHLEELHKAEEKCEGCAKAEGTGEDKQIKECLVQRYQQFASSFLLNQRSWEQQADEQGASTAEREQARKRDEEEATARLGAHVGLAPVRCGSCGETKARSCLTLDAHWLEQLVNSQAFQNASLYYHPVSLAVVNRDEQALRWLLANGLPADPHEPKPSEPSTPLALCVFQLSDCLLRNEELLAIARIVDVLLRHGANPLGPLALAIDRYGPACTSPDSSSASAVSSSPAGWSCLPLIAKAAEQWQTKA